MATANTLAKRKQRTNKRASQRRHVALGAVEAGPEGAAVGAVTAARPARSQRTSSPPITRTRTRSRRLPSAGGFKGPSLSGAHTSSIFAEYIVAVVIISLGIFVRGGAQGYTVVISNVMMRLTALTAVFFVLFLMAGSKRGGQAAMWFGLLVDLAIVLQAARSQTFSTTADIIAGKGTGVDSTTLASSTTATEPTRVQLPDE